MIDEPAGVFPRALPYVFPPPRKATPQTVLSLMAAVGNVGIMRKLIVVGAGAGGGAGSGSGGGGVGAGAGAAAFCR